ncbi:MAG: DUF1993 domain-containing protein [Piscinibacter sp.]
MKPPWLYEASVPVLLRYLDSLDRVLDAVDALPPARAAQVLHARLAPDMLPFARQVETAAYFTLRTACPLAGRAVPPFVAAAPTLAGLRERVEAARTLLRSLAASEFADAGTRVLSEHAGEALVELPAARFLAEYALPNFFFHLGMAYAISRQQGCALGKAAYDGFHVYPGC